MVAVVFVLLGIAIAVNGCGGSSSSGGTGGAGGAAGKGGAGGGTAGTGGAPACSAATGPGSGATCNVIAAGGACVTGDLFDRSATGAGGWRVRGWHVQPRFADLLRLGRGRSKLPPRRTLPSHVCPLGRHLDLVHPRSDLDHGDNRGPIARDRGRVGNDRDLHPDLSGSGRGSRLGRRRRVHRDLELDHAVPADDESTGAIEVTVYNKAP